MKKIFLIISTIVFLGGGFYFYNIIINKSAFNNEALELFSVSKPIAKKVSFKEIENLPKPVKEYFSNVLKEGDDYISYVRLKHSGSFKASIKSDWSSIYGVSYISVDIPAFVWQGRIPLMVTTQRYIKDKGSNTITLLDFINYSNNKGYEYNKKEFTKWISQALLHPTTLLPSNIINWEPIDNSHAKLIAKYNDLKVVMNVYFKNGLIEKITTNRYMGKKGFKKWIVEVDNYQFFEKYKIPTRLKYSWKLEDEIFNYADFYITKAEFNTPEILNK
jgi:hypothetical protein